MEFRQIEAFINVAKYKSFSKAADATYLTQPTVSLHVASLEKELGVILFDRKKTHVNLTDDGKEFYKYAVALIDTRKKATEEIRKNKEDINGVVEIQTSTVPGLIYLPKAMKAFKELHPKVKFYVEQTDTKLVLESLEEKRAEIGFVSEEKRSANLRYHKIFTDSLVLIVGKENRLFNANKEALAIEDYISEQFIWREQGSGTRKDFENFLDVKGQDPKKMEVVARMNSMEGIKNAVSENLGISIISKSLISNKLDESIRVFELEEFNNSREFFVAWDPKRLLSTQAEAFKEFLLNPI